MAGGWIATMAVLAGAPIAVPVQPDFPAAGLAPPACWTEPTATAPLDLPTLVDLALCRSPDTAAAWASVRAAAAREAQVRAGYGPRLDGSIGPGVSVARTFGGPFPARTDSAATASASLSLGWLLYDFGGREARLDSAAAARALALAGFADQAQAIVLETGLGYYGVLSALAAEEAARANLSFARVSLAAATARERAGAGIRSDRLQADAAEAQALLQLRRAEGDLATARGRLATALALPPTTPLVLAPPPRPETAAALQQSAGTLIDRAQALRPDLRLRDADVASAEAAVAQARANQRPSVNLGATTPSLALNSGSSDSVGASAGVTLSIPLFDSGGRTAAIQAARADLEASRLDRERARLGAAQDVWQRFQAFRVQAESLETAERQLRSASEAAELAQGRYRAGLASITELLNAQSDLADARRAQVDAAFGVRTAELQLARAVGSMGDVIGGQR
jgi:outer membrane protein